ncbi:hypothetical protein HPP92_022056 [Vanilla planifolia]|uniref:Cupin-like domain-containing protein n=1 Tax=Vanilla planifolia TaxID=51239 RepID=A0A835PSK3_VANPL|nr:hypothetical protein HPP92_022056 [Vanilla planifolia]
MAPSRRSSASLPFPSHPIPKDFSTDIEPSNVPAVFHGAIKEWKAVTKWNPSAGGLDYLQERVGSAVVDAMMSKSAPIFYGDLRNYERVSIPFASFMTACRSYHKGISTFSGHGDNAKLSNLEEIQTSVLDALDLIYLAQVPIVNQENKEPCPLDMLRDDLEMPTFLVNKELASINLWMNRARSRSSTHYDPHHNLLCLVAGCKQVDLVNPDYSLHTRAINSDGYSQKVVLHPVMLSLYQRVGTIKWIVMI